MDASIFDSALSHTRRSDASENRKENRVVELRSVLNVFASEQVSSPRLYRLKLENFVNIFWIDSRKTNFLKKNEIELKSKNCVKVS